MTVRWTVRAKPDRAPQRETSSPSTPAKKDKSKLDLSFLLFHYYFFTFHYWDSSFLENCFYIKNIIKEKNNSDFSLLFFGRGRRTRTLTNGFGDRCATIDTIPLFKINSLGGASRTRTADQPVMSRLL